MYLKSIQANGFKSFADKIDLEIRRGITAIVGPNGSGKSNIVDAVRWVLGEQSIKSLRGEEMRDVIFSGSKTRPSASRAYVSLTFDNTDHYLNTEFTEVEIKRVIYKTGENEYFLNNNKVRLKDITDLFLDTGASLASFNIISQGSVADIINNKPENRRLIFEDAAGVLKYKKRKEISLKKLEKTEENLARIKLVIDELAISVEPLKKESEIAEKYQEYQKELKNIDIALIAEDITNINQNYKKLQKEINILEQDITKISTSNNEDNTLLEKLKLEDLKLNDAITLKNNEYIKLTENLASLEAEKLVTLERQKYESSPDNLNTILLKLKEEQLNLKNLLTSSENRLQDLIKDIKTTSIAKEEVDNILLTSKFKKNSYLTKINEYEKNILNFQNEIDILTDNLNNNSKMPSAVKAILNNIRLTGVHNTIGSLIDTENIYTSAISLSLGASSNFLVVDNELVSKECINYLKENKLGRATFFPLNIIKAKTIKPEDLNKISKHPGFINIASNLVTYDSKYQNIIANQLGNILVVKDIDALNAIAKILEYKYKIVSLDGQIIYPGGSITGGSLTINNNLTDKQKLSEKQEKLELFKLELANINKEYTEFSEKLNTNEEKSLELNKKLISLNEILNTRTNEKKRLEEELEKKELEIKGNEEISSKKLEPKLLAILEEVSSVSATKEATLTELNNLKNEKSSLVMQINELESKYKRINTDYNHLQNNLKEKEIEVGKLDVKLDNLLGILNDTYEMTYEYARNNYELDMPEDLARIKVESLKKEISKLGTVNLGAIEEYNRLKTRYEFLINQSEDLKTSSAELKKIILEMDEIMISKFKETFNLINKEFNIVFKKLFKGGTGILKLTNPDDLLTTGIDIIAEPPGKKLNSISILSGGEKTLTAISLLFAILNVKPSPFCILDEIEAALDEINVDTFGKYLQEKKDQNQFILITHKKRTMEYADVLYGITMQESGVSKLVSVDLVN